VHAATTPLLAPRLALRLGTAELALAPGRTYTVGSAADNDVRVEHATVASRHATIAPGNGGFAIEDLGSPAGIAINGRRVRRAVLQPGDAIGIGAITVRVVRAGATPPTSTFQQVMASELQRAPWLLLSAAIHAAVLLLLWWLLHEPQGTARDAARLAIAHGEHVSSIEEARPEPQVVIEDEPQEDPLQDPALAAAEPDAEELQETASAPRPDWRGADAGLLTRIKTSARPQRDILREGGQTVAAGGFGRTVSELRRSGLEIVFVFDSTGSMAGVLGAAKARIAQMAEALHALVPDSRVGVVTYRDRDGSEEYLTRSVPLAQDFYRAINFMQVVSANGGGDPPEAVLEGLEEALRQTWNPTARRVVVLVGDAPPHKATWARIRARVGAFVKDGRSCVHAIVTATDERDRTAREALRAFEEIARLGRGQCLQLGNDVEILRHVLSLAFGSEFRRNIDEVFAILQRDRHLIPPATQAWVQRNDRDALARELDRRPVADEVVRALIGADRAVLRSIVELANRPDLSGSARQAISYVLQQALDLQRPPLDPLADGPPPPAVRRALLDLLER
jgi:Mg-chelatase subunit ChlD